MDWAETTASNKQMQCAPARAAVKTSCHGPLQRNLLVTWSLVKGSHYQEMMQTQITIGTPEQEEALRNDAGSD
jgi:hypothetical protein